ncbi:hypothetical protein ACFQBQ_02880 [Granulicella cerasi]|uniref:Transposase n=1 Tax=Granulicella cerasi TaxID=741063 RepID=A0ABW1Z6G7_9BACT|nr:hypothetical protein [Granulicella cerasi]
MRSKKFHQTLACGNSRFEMCNMIAKGMRATHVTGTRIEDSINRVMGLMEPKPVVVKLQTIVR